MDKEWYAIYKRVFYVDGTHEDLLQEPPAYFRDERTAEAVAGVLSLASLEGMTSMIVKTVTGKFTTEKYQTRGRVR